jgi:two-component system nitrogen regulation sensor histidine kinase NtrY
MTFRTRLLLIFTAAVIVAVGVVEWVVATHTRDTFEGLEARRVDATVAQFQQEFARRKREVVRAVDAIAASDTARNLALASDYSEQSAVAEELAMANGLDLLELVSSDGTIISSAQWSARFGRREDWIMAGGYPTSPGSFFKREELPDKNVLALMAVATTTVGDRKLYVAGGEQLEPLYTSALVLPAGMRVLLYRNLEPRFNAAGLLNGRGNDAAQFRGLIEQVRQTAKDVKARIGSGPYSETVYAWPLVDYENKLLGVLLIASSRRELVELEAAQLRIGIMVAAFGILVGVALSWWATARVTRPVRRLAESAGKVAAGNWSATVEVSSADEIGLLARAFNHMTHELVEHRERLVQAERVAAWRELARRLAHELKNPLFPLQITVENMQRARERYPEQFDEVFREGSATLLAELSNLKQIIGRFSDFAKMPAPEMQTVDLNALAAETMKLFDSQLQKARVEARTELDGNLPKIQADAEQMTRVLRNLVLNAIDAMPEGGVLTVRTAAQGSGARLEVSDTGQGLTPEECARLFTPYYTTKTHGTGLGLAIVQSVVSDHKGRISVDSQPGKGATFRIELG